MNAQCIKKQFMQSGECLFIRLHWNVLDGTCRPCRVLRLRGSVWKVLCLKQRFRAWRTWDVRLFQKWWLECRKGRHDTFGRCAKIQRILEIQSGLCCLFVLAGSWTENLLDMSQQMNRSSWNPLLLSVSMWTSKRRLPCPGPRSEQCYVMTEAEHLSNRARQWWL